MKAEQATALPPTNFNNTIWSIFCIEEPGFHVYSDV